MPTLAMLEGRGQMPAKTGMKVTAMHANGKAGRYDVFVSFSDADLPFARELDERLRERRLRTFFERADLSSGLPWIVQLEAAIAKSAAVVVLVGGHGIGNIQQYERDLALVRQTHEKDFPVIPVLIPGCTAPPTGFLELLTWVDLRDGLGGTVELEKLIAALHRQDMAAASVRDSVCPYMGLEPFCEEDAPFFCGREAAVRDLVDRVRESSLVAVVGRSGSGKSSLVFAGLLPALRRQSPDVVWDVLTLRPGPWPLHSLAEALGTESRQPAALNDVASTPSPLSREAKIDRWASQLRPSANGTVGDRLARLVVRRLDAAREQPHRLLVYIDQWEELYAMSPTEDETRAAHARDVDAFIAHIVALASDSRARARVVLTVRADFYGALIAHPALGKLLPHQQVNVGPMTREDLRATLTIPAQKAGLSFEAPTTRGSRSLVDRVLDDAGTDEAVLPLLQYAMKETWARRNGLLLTETGYSDGGGVQGAIRASANRTYGQLDEQEKAIARRLFLGLVTPGEGTEDTRARLLMPEDPAIRAVIAKFADRPSRLLVTGSDAAVDESGPRATVEVAHEALIRTWSELRHWLAENRETLRSRAAIVQRQREWEENDKKPELLLPAGFPLERGKNLLAKPGDVPVEDVRRYIELSERIVREEEERRAAQTRQEEEAEKTRLRTQTRDRTLVAIAATTIASCLAGLAVFASVQRSEARRAESDAIAALRQANEASASDLARSAILTAHDDALERETVAFALRAAAKWPGVVNVPELSLAGISAWRVAPRVGRWHGHWAGVGMATFSPDGTRVVTASADDTARIWDAQNGKVLCTLWGHSGPVQTAAFSPDGTRVVTASWDDTARVWDAQSGKLLCTLEGHSAKLNGAAFSPDGTRVVTASDDRTARVWNAEDGLPLMTLEGHSSIVNTAAFSPDGMRVVTASHDKTARIWDAQSESALSTRSGGSHGTWDVQKGKMLSTLEGHSDEVNMAVFSPDGTRVVTASDDKTARVWDTQSGTLVSMLKGHSAHVVKAAFSADGTRIVTASTDKTARLWDARSGEALRTFEGHSSMVSTAAFSPDGTRIVTASTDKTARLWDVLSGRALGTFEGHTDSVTAAFFSPDGTRMVTASWDHTARVWDAQRKRVVGTLVGHSSSVGMATFSPDGTRVVTASTDETARIWDARDGTLLNTLKGHSDASSGELGNFGPIVNTATFSPDGARVVTASLDKTARVWDAQSGKELCALKGHSSSVEGAAFSPDGTRVVTASIDETARIWDAQACKALCTLQGHRSHVYTAAFSPDGTRVLTASADKTARIWDAHTCRLLNTLTDHSDSVWMAAYSPDGKRVVTASKDKTSRIWDVQSGEVLTLAGHLSPVNAAAFSPDGTRVLTTSDDTTARIWDARTGKLLSTLMGHSSGLYTGAFSPDGTRVVTTSADRTARIWNAQGGKLISTLEGHSHVVRTAAFSPDGARVVTGSDDNTARIWPLNYADAVVSLCATVADSIRYAGPDYADLADICRNPPVR
jgi:WD40 repeat protein